MAATLALTCVAACDGETEPAVPGGADLASAHAAAALPAAIETRASALEAQTRIWGYRVYEPGENFNRCVPFASKVLNRMNGRGELLAMHYNSAGYAPLSGSSWHTQSIVRLPYLWWDSVLLGQYFVEDFSHEPGSSVYDDSHLGVAGLGFTGGNAGKPIGTNRAYNDGSSGSDWLIAPNPSDTFLPVNGTPKFKIDETQNHAGGMSASGWQLVVPLQQWDYGVIDDFPFYGGYIPGGSQPWVNFYDMWEPQSPVLTSRFRTFGPNGTGNDAAAFTKLNDGRFLLAVEKGDPLNRIELYVSQFGTSPSTPGAFGADGREPDATMAGYPGWPNMNFLTDCDNGDLYLIGFKGNVGGTTDKVYLRKVSLYGGGTEGEPPFRAVMTDPPSPGLAEKNMFCSNNVGSDECDFEAGAGSYIDPNGHVVVYGTSWGNSGTLYKPQYPNYSGPCSLASPGTPAGCSDTPLGLPYLVRGNAPTNLNYQAQSGFVGAVEFHERHGNSDSSSACPTLDKAWVEFYDNTTYNTALNDPSKYYYIDISRWTEKPYHDLRPNYFNDLPTSVRWCLPDGNSLAVYSAVGHSGGVRFLNGTGHVQRIPNLANYTYTYTEPSRNMNNDISSYYFYQGYEDTWGLVGESDPEY